LAIIIIDDHHHVLGLDSMKSTSTIDAVEFIDFYEVTYSFINLRILIIFILHSSHFTVLTTAVPVVAVFNLKGDTACLS
jgi:hypothetical protein